VGVVGAATRARAAAVAVAVVVVIRATVVIGADAVAVVEGDKGGPGEEDAVHNAKRPRGLEHGAGLVGAQVEVGVGEGDAAGRRGVGAVAGEAGAVRVGNAAQVVDGGDEGADKGGVDEGDEAGVGRGAVVAEEGEDGPGESEDGDDEEEEDGGWGEGVDLVEAVDEPGEHAHGGDQGDDLQDARSDKGHCEKHGGRVVRKQRLDDVRRLVWLRGREGAIGDAM
jgi:hypothetical protein